jgi:transcriptional regulator with XRE-family HTH domain
MATPRHDWYLKEWLRTLKKRQADISRDLDMNKAKVSLTASGKQPYDRETVNAIADYLNIRPYELLMHPDDAMALRRLRADMLRLASQDASNESRETPMPVKKVSLT